MTTCLGKLLIRFTARAFRNLMSIYVFSYFPFGFDGRVWGLIVSVPDHCLSFFTLHIHCENSGLNVKFELMLMFISRSLISYIYFFKITSIHITRSHEETLHFDTSRRIFFQKQ